MTTPTDNLRPKVHPLTRSVEPDDPMELIATPVEGDPQVMLECMVQEFAWMGWSSEAILGLFRSPAYPVLNQLYERFGEDYICETVQGLVDRYGVVHFSETIAEDPESDDDDEPELTQLSVTRVRAAPG